MNILLIVGMKTRGQMKDKEYINQKTNIKCPKCSEFLHKETEKMEHNYPYVCLECGENFFEFETKVVL